MAAPFFMAFLAHEVVNSNPGTTSISAMAIHTLFRIFSSFLRYCSFE
jgi:hypothetical protein